MENPHLAASVLKLVNSPEFRPCKPKSIAKQLDIAADEYPQLRKTLKKLVREGFLAFGANHLIRPVSGHPQAATEQPKGAGRPRHTVHREASAPNADESLDTYESSDANEGSDTVKSRRSRRQSKQLIRGTFRSAVGGFGFVRPLDPELLESPDDIFIPARFVRSAMEGDLVDVRLLDSRGQGAEGAVEEIVTRGRRKFVGTFQKLNGEPVVWLDGVTLEYPIAIGDVRGLPIENDNKVVVELVKYPEVSTSGHFMAGEGVILEVLGTSKNPAVDTLAILHQFNLPGEFPDTVLDEARSVADRFDENDTTGRRDLTDVPTLTIDPVDARDFDDAISLRRNETGNWELMVHIADVCHFVAEGSRLDEEAAERATSVYLPDRVIPMLPEIISNSLASLQPNKRRFARTVVIEMNEDGLPIHAEFFSSVIMNQQRLTYEMVDQFLEQPTSLELTPEITRLLKDMHTLAMTLRQRRMDHGAIELNLPEVKIDLDRAGKVKGAHLTQYTDSHKMIEEFMLAANQAVASHLDRLEIPFMRRVHPAPQGIKLKRLTEFMRAIGIEAGSMQNRFEIQRVVNEVRGTPLEQAVNYAILKSMSKAIYQPQAERHYALDMQNYCHFTSPIRRYPDLIVHRILERVVSGEPATTPIQVLVRQGQHCSDKEQNAEQAERALVRVKLLHYMAKRVGETFTGTVTTVKADRIVVQLHEVPVEGSVNIRTLPPDRYRFDRQSYCLEGYRRENRFRLGDVLLVRVTDVDLAKRELHYAYEGRATTHSFGTKRLKRKRPQNESGEHLGPTKSTRVRSAKPSRNSLHPKPNKKTKRSRRDK